LAITIIIGPLLEVLSVGSLVFSARKFRDRGVGHRRGGRLLLPSARMRRLFTWLDSKS
jgi:hypothetical protein